jgi:hypothetical protein
MNAFRLIESVWTLTIVAVLVLIMYALTGCASAPQCVRPVVDLPAPILPLVQAEDLACLRDPVYQSLALRDHALQSALRECRAVVEELTE